MLIGNYASLTKSPLRYLAGSAASPETTVAIRFSSTGSQRNRIYVDQTTTALAYLSVPGGSYPPVCWMLPQVAGGLAARNQIFGDASVTASGAMGLNAESALTGEALLTATGALIVSALSAITAGANVSAALNAVVEAAAALGGTTTFANSVLGALASMAAPLTGTASATATTFASGSMDAELLSYSALTPEGIRDVVWAHVIEAGYTAEDVVRLLAAHAAGEATGMNGPTTEFTGLDGSTVRITGDLANGVRSNVVLDASA